MAETQWLAIINWITAAGIVIFGFAYVIERIRLGKKQSDADLALQREDLIKTQRERLEAQREIIEDLKLQAVQFQKQLTALTGEVAHQKGLNEAMEKKIQEYMQIITNRNPDLDKTLTSLAEITSQVMPFIHEMRESHKAIRKALHIQ